MPPAFPVGRGENVGGDGSPPFSLACIVLLDGAPHQVQVEGFADRSITGSIVVAALRVTSLTDGKSALLLCHLVSDL